MLTALAVWFLLRKNRGPVGLVVAAAGALAAALVAWQVGRRVGLAGYQRLLDTAPEGTRFSKPADLRAGGIELFLGVLPLPYGNVLLPAFAAAVTYTLLAGWSRWPSLRPEPEPDVTWLTAPAPVPAGPAGRRFGPAGTGGRGQFRQRHRNRPHLAKQRRLAVEQVQLGAKPGRRVVDGEQLLAVRHRQRRGGGDQVGQHRRILG